MLYENDRPDDDSCGALCDNVKKHMVKNTKNFFHILWTGHFMLVLSCLVFFYSMDNSYRGISLEYYIL